MSPRIMCHHHSLSDTDRDFITGKVANLRKYFERIVEVSVILDATKHECLAELLMFGPQISLRVKHTAGDMRTAFEGALNKAERKLRKTREKQIANRKHGKRNVTIRRFNPETESVPSPDGNNGINPKTEEINLLHRNAKDQVELVELTGTVLFQPSGMEIAEGQ